MSVASGLTPRLRRGSATVLNPTLGIGLTVGLWWAVSLLLDPVQLPSPLDVASAFVQGWDGIDALEYVGFQTGGIRDGLIYTTRNVIVGAGIGAVLGIVVGAFIGAFRSVAAVLGPPLVVLGATPILVILPFVLIWFGTSTLAQSALVIGFTFVTVAAVTQSAVTNVGQQYLQFGSCLGASKARLFWSVTLPAALPATWGAIRVSVALGWSFATVSELIGSQQGTGKIIQAMAQLQRTADVLATALAIAVVALLVDMAIVLLGRILVRWKE